MHILQIYKDYPPVLGGIEHHIRDLSEGLLDHGFQITVLVTTADAVTTLERIHTGLEIIRVRRDLAVASTPLSIDFVRQAQQLHPDVIHLHFPYPPGDLAALRVPGRPPLIVTYHSDIVRQRTLRQLYYPLMRHTLGRAARILATSPDYVQSSVILQNYSHKIRIIPLGIDIERFAQLPERQILGLGAGLHAGTEDVLLLFVGRLRYYKGLHILLEAMPHIMHAQLLLAGSGPEEQGLRAQVQALGLQQRVHFLGDVSDALLPALYRAADIFVLPAHVRAEALGLAQIEAMASGLPCVSTRLGTGTTYANRHGITGLSVAPGNVADLARAINTLVADPALRRRYAAAAQRRARALFSRETMVDAVAEVYREVMVSR